MHITKETKAILGVAKESRCAKPDYDANGVSNEWYKKQGSKGSHGKKAKLS